ncbi:hypothetical protein GCM10009122_41570 [Fulvivirga kasyanovii]|uniref:Intradiol ring-cleavage dioxygenase n=1 Tax=Fulvivirga kasyanovii TaxID=396812 RepID=A0ABW9RTL1_9BACT|nr:intradiol ring-cleavage dioxygenase [Fulvivirga kasyanovii]MTI27343.1 intradiol ring-cleavage dioxygenase [Fulvivirga kasyanovii]
MRTLLFILLTIHCLAACNAQQKETTESITKSSGPVGGPCEGCEALHEYGDKILTSSDTLPGFDNQGQKIKVTGIVYHKDGKTPARDVILYIYHTNQEGIYPTRGDEEGWAKRHGYIRGWIKTGADGKYTFYTLKPGSYPSGSNPAHIHPTIKEPDLNAYYIDTWHFKGDPLLQESHLSASPRGGSGLLTLEQEGELWVARKDIVLGLNIPGYK